MDLLGMESWWLIIPALLVVLGYMYLTWTHGYWLKRGVPYLEPELFFGSIKANIVGKMSLGETYRELYQKLKDHKYGGAFKFRQPILVLRDPEIIKTVLVKDFTSFQDNDFHSNVDIDPLFGRNPFVLKGDLWKTSRTKLTPAFTPIKLKPLYPLIQDVCNDMMEALRKSADEGSLNEAKELATKFTADSVGTCAFGVRQNSFKDPDSEFRTIGRKFLEPTFWKGIEQSCVILLPKFADFLKFKFTPTEVIEFFRRMTKETVTYRQQNNVQRNDFLQMLIQLKERAAAFNSSNDKSIPWFKKFTDEDIAAQALTFFTDGYDTSATALACLILDLANNPDVQERLREEVDAVIQKHDGHLTFDIILEMPYLEMVFNESLRMHPPVPLMNRLCTKPYELPLPDGGSLTVEEGTPVITPLLGLHYDPEYYPNPNKYDPERFTEENKESRPKYTYMPFGEGPRICLGMRFGTAQNKTCVVNLLSEFEIRKCSMTPDVLTPVPQAFLFSSKEKMWIEIVKRPNKQVIHSPEL